jgi:hypothetical protein
MLIVRTIHCVQFPKYVITLLKNEFYNLNYCKILSTAFLFSETNCQTCSIKIFSTFYTMVFYYAEAIVK